MLRVPRRSSTFATAIRQRIRYSIGPTPRTSLKRVAKPDRDTPHKRSSSRADTTMEARAKLKPVVRASGTITAGHASGINDGAAALLIASEAAALGHSLHPRARIIASAAAGVAREHGLVLRVV